MISSYFALTAAQQTFTVDGQTFEAVGPIFGFAQMGFMRYPMTFCALMVLVLAGRAAWHMRSGEPESSTLARARIDGSLFWGGYALALGLLGTVVGITLAAQSVEAAGEAPTRVVWGGIKVALSTTIYGFLVFLVAGLIWFGLRHWHRRMVLGAA